MEEFVTCNSRNCSRERFEEEKLRTNTFRSPFPSLFVFILDETGNALMGL
jgi:hypothetical protein